jgi:predicted kinase
MVYWVLLRGPLGVGKTAVSERLTGRIGGHRISIDRILDEHQLEEWEDGYISLRSFLRANALAADEARPFLARGTPVIVDGNFYHRPQVEDLRKRLESPALVFTLKAPLELCIERDAQRLPSFGATAAREVFAKATEFEVGVGIDATQPLELVVDAIVSHLP